MGNACVLCRTKHDVDDDHAHGHLRVNHTDEEIRQSPSMHVLESRFVHGHDDPSGHGVSDFWPVQRSRSLGRPTVASFHFMCESPTTKTMTPTLWLLCRWTEHNWRVFRLPENIVLYTQRRQLNEVLIMHIIVLSYVKQLCPVTIAFDKYGLIWQIYLFASSNELAIHVAGRTKRNIGNLKILPRRPRNSLAFEFDTTTVCSVFARVSRRRSLSISPFITYIQLHLLSLAIWTRTGLLYCSMNQVDLLDADSYFNRKLCSGRYIATFTAEHCSHQPIRMYMTF